MTEREQYAYYNVYCGAFMSKGVVHILYNADGVGGGVGLGFVILCYIWWGGGFDFCYITLLKFLTYVIF